MIDRKIGLFWLTNDLRLHDNPALMLANSLADELICVYAPLHELDNSADPFAQTNCGDSRKQFLYESLNDLEQNLRSLGQRLDYLDKPALSSISGLIEQLDVTHIFRSDNAGWYENQLWDALKQRHPGKTFQSINTHTLFEIDDLPFSLEQLPSSFTKFKNALRDHKPLKPIARLTHLPAPPPSNLDTDNLPKTLNEMKPFNGGESAGLAHLKGYFSTVKPAHYKEIRNAIDGWDNSCKLSPWLANGCLSVREVVAVPDNYERDQIANDSTYWIYFELLWREYFQWYAHLHGHRLFSFAGIKGVSPLNSYYPERFQKWVHGSTPYPLVNACMIELKTTGFLSNRGRQIVASCFVNELAMDWRYGAAYFESVLIDYDIAANWGNWQYLAGVGADARDKRHFNLEKQTAMFDPTGRYVDAWTANQTLQPLDSVDAADWPIA